MNVVAVARILTTYRDNKPNNLWPNNPVDDCENRQYEKAKTCHAAIITYNDDYYVITCYHGIQNHTDIKLYVNLNDKIVVCNLRECYSVKQYDFSLLQFDCHDKDTVYSRFVTNYDFNLQKDELLYAKFLGTGKTVDNPLEDFANNNLKCTFKQYTYAKIKSELYPSIPIIELQQPERVIDLCYEGLSGSLICDANNNVHGMLSYFHKNTFGVIPSYCLNIFLAMCISKETIRSLCLQTNICNFMEKVYGHIVENGYNIAYKTDTDTEIKFNKHDIIESINDLCFDDKGCIFFDKIKMRVPIDTYILLNNSKYCKLKYYVKQRKEYTETVVRVEPVDLETHTVFRLEYHPKIVTYKGLLITEMSEQLLNHYNSVGVKLGGYIEKYYNDCFTKKTGSKTLVVVNVDYRGLDEQTASKYKLLGIPLVEKDSKHYIPIVSKVNSTKVTDLADFEKKISKKQNVSITIDLEKGINFVL